MADSPTSLLKKTLIYCKKLEQTTDDETLLLILEKLSRLHFTLDLLQSSGAGKIIRELSKKSGLVGQKASSLLKKLREVVAESQKACETLKQNKSTEKVIHKHHTKEKYDEKYIRKNNFKERAAELMKDAHFNDKHAKLKNYHITLKHSKTKDKHSIDKHVKDKHLYKNSSSHKEYKATELDISSTNSSPSSDKNTLKHFAGIKYPPCDGDNTTIKVEAVLPSLSAKSNDCKSVHEKTHKLKLKSESSKYKNETKSRDAKISEVSEKKNHNTPKHSKHIEAEEHFIDKQVKHVKDKHLYTKNSFHSSNHKEYKSTELDVDNKHLSYSEKNTSLKYFSDINSNPFFDVDDKITVKPEAVLHSSKNKEREYLLEPNPKKPKLPINESSKHKSETKSHDRKNNEVSKEKKSLHYNSNDFVSKTHKKDKSLNIDKKTSKGSVLKKPKIKVEKAEAFTASETTFEDCLSFNDFVSLKKKKRPKSHSTSSISKDTFKKIKTSNLEVNNSNIKTGHVDIKKEICDKSISEMFPYEQNFKIETDDILLNLPETQPNYKPLPHRIDYSPIKKKAMSNEEAIIFTSSRREKTAVYSGKRTCYLTKVPTLFESCTRVLIENIDDIEYMGEIPYFLLESLLQRCTATQLYRLEDFNPHLLEDTDQLWEVHCKRDFRTAKPEENETWRELYWRTRDEREAKLRNVTANISASIASSNPVRKAKLAYIDSVVKPPRDVIRRQMKSCTALSVPRTIKNTSLSTSASTSSAVFATVPSTSRAWAFKPQKPKVAPLMAKTLKSMKQCFRR